MTQAVFWPIILSIVAALSGSPGHEVMRGQVYYNHEVGIAVTKPDRWLFLQRLDTHPDGPGVRLADGELMEYYKERVVKSPNNTVVSFAKYREPTKKFNPAVYVSMVSTGEEGYDNPSSEIASFLDANAKAYPDTTVIDSGSVVFQGHDAAYAKLKFSIPHDGDVLKTTGSIWFIERGGFYFTITLFGPQEGEDYSEKAFTDILNSLRIDP